MKKIRIQIQLMALFVLLAWMIPTAAAQASPLAAYPPDPTADISWSGGMSGVADIQSAFNHARTVENTQLGSSIPMMTLPSQSEWNSKSDGEKALWLINRERIDRGVLPLENIESNVTSVAQTYADYLFDHNTWGHTADGRDPWQRLDANPAIGACHDFLGVSENIAVLVTSGSNIPLPIERSIYMWMYEDIGSGWGHRHAILWYDYNNDNGPSDSEGFLGIGRANGGPYKGPFSQSWNYAELVVMNVFDPCSSFSPPRVISIVRAGATNPTNASSVDFTVMFSESVTGVTLDDFTLFANGVAGASRTSVSGSGASYTVKVGTGSGSGTIRLDVVDDNSITSTASSNLLGGVGLGDGNFSSGEIYTIDKTAPVVTSVVRASTNPTAAASVNFTVTFSEVVTGVDKTDFSLNTSGVTSPSIGTVTGSGTTYTVPVNTGSGSGTIRLDVVNNASILDTVSNAFASGFTTGETYTIDKTPPTLNLPAPITQESARSLGVIVNFAVTASDAVDPSPIVNCIPPSGSTFALGVTLVSCNASDASGNAASGSFNVTVQDTTPPVVVSIVTATSLPVYYNSVNFKVIFFESVTGVDKTDFSLAITGNVTGASIRDVSGSGVTRLVTVFTGSGDGGIRLDMLNDNSIKDLSNNLLSGGFTGGEVFVKEKDAFPSDAPKDGWTLESSEFSNLASTKSSSGTLRIGDDARNRQYRSFLYFDTTNLPNNAVISKVTAQITRAGLTGDDPFITHGFLVADMKKGFFGPSSLLELADFSAAGTPMNTAQFTTSDNTLYQLTLSPLNFKYINLLGVTQFRLRFTKDDNNDRNADFVSFYDGEVNSPELIIEYSVP